MRRRARSRRGSAIGTADSSDCVYGCDGASYSASRVGDLDDPAEVHHRDAIARVAHHRQVVGDEDEAQVELVLELVEQVEHLRLDRHVERRHRLVEHDHLRTERQRPGDADALALTAGELVRVAVAVLGQQADPLEQVGDPLTASRSSRTPWIRIGSPMMSRTGMRGLSDAYGSWKTICMSRRSVAQRLARRRVTSSHRTSPGPTSARSGAGANGRACVLPHPDSPTTPSVS